MQVCCFSSSMSSERVAQKPTTRFKAETHPDVQNTSDKTNTSKKSNLVKRILHSVGQWLLDKLNALFHWGSPSDEMAELVARHELGHALVSYFNGYKNVEIEMFKDGGYASSHFDFKTEKDYRKRLLTLVSGFVFQVLSIQDKESDKAYLQTDALVNSRDDMRKVVKLLIKARKEGFLSIDEKINLAEFDAARFTRIQKKASKGKKLSEEELDVVRLVKNSLMQTIKIPIVKEAMKTSAAVFSMIGAEKYQQMTDCIASQRGLKEGEMEAFVNNHLSEEKQVKLKEQLRLFLEKTNW